MKFNVKPKGLNVAIAILSVAAVICVVLCVLTFTTDLFTPQPDYADLILYEGPKPVPASTVAAMKVDGNELFVYDTAVNNTHSWANNYKPSLSKAPVTSFDFEGAPVTMEITVTGHGEQTLLTAQFDNLGKGASGAAVQNMNIMLGFPESTGLNID